MTTLTASTPAWKDVDPATAKDWLSDGRAVLIDVREADEHARESIAGAEVFPSSRFDLSGAVEVGRGRTVIVHCQGGRRSAQACQRLVQAGLKDVHNLAGGIEAWKKAGLPVHLNPRAPLPLMQQTQIAAGMLILIGLAMTAIVSPWWLILTGLVGFGLVIAGATGFCGMAKLLALMPWNR